MTNNVITNIGHANTDFTATGGLNLDDDLAINGSTLVVDVSANSIGLGDSSPDSTLEIVTHDSTIPLMISNGSDGDYLSVLANGDVGINDASPDYLLDVNGTLGVTGATTLSNTLSVTGAITAAADITVDTNVLKVDTTNNRVGVGTAAPDTALHVVGQFKLVDGTQANTNVLQSNAAGVASWVTTDSINDFNNGGDASVGDRTLGNTNDHSLGFITNNLNRLQIDNGGNLGVHTTSPTSTLHVNGSIASAIRTVSVNATLASTDSAVLVDASGGTITVTLPPAANVEGRIYYIKKKDSSVNTVVIEGDGAETVDGAANAELEVQYQGYRLQSDGGEWWIF